MAAGGEKSAIPFERNASIPVRDGAAKSCGKLARNAKALQIFCRRTEVITRSLRWTKSRNSVMESKLLTGMQSPQWPAIQRPFSWQG
jgi:hypothetical protein